jgi:two-component system, NtrC family, response regulator AtoC
MTHKILVADDEKAILQSISRSLVKQGYVVVEAENGSQAVAGFEKHSPALTLLDFKMPGMDGMETLRSIRQIDPEAAVIMMTAFGDIPLAVEAMKAGAESFLEKPVNFEYLLSLIPKILEKVELSRQEHPRTMQAPPRRDFQALGRSPKIRKLIEISRLLAENEQAPILLMGDSGTGKGFLARLIHEAGKRSRYPLVTINCAGLSPTFLESELFGHEKGAFTDAKVLKRGLLEYGDGGTIFLDEIGDLPIEVQPKLLQVLEDRTFRRLGGNNEIQVNVRFIFTSNKNLKSEVEKGNFREDLFYRINVMPLELPPLRERPEDIEFLARNLLQELNTGRSDRPSGLAEETLRALQAYPWPGNIRELRNLLERGLILSRGESVELQHLPPEVGHAPPAEDLLRPFWGGEKRSLEAIEREYILWVLEENEGNRSQTARDLGIARTTLLDKLRKYGMDGAC